MSTLSMKDYIIKNHELDKFKLNVKEKGKVNDNTAKIQSTNQLGV